MPLPVAGAAAVPLNPPQYDYNHGPLCFYLLLMLLLRRRWLQPCVFVSVEPGIFSRLPDYLLMTKDPRPVPLWHHFHH
jgi:hypothetical protein